MRPRPSSGPVSRRPADDEISVDDHRDLIERLRGDCVLKIFQQQSFWLCELASSLSTEQIDRLHSPYTWTIRQVVEHCADAERVFGDRMMRIAAGDQTDLPAWDENAYAASRFGLGNFGHLVTELGFLREANALLLRRIGPRVWDNRGKVDGKSVTVRGLAWVAAGHLAHHLRIIEDRCGVTVKMPPGG